MPRHPLTETHPELATQAVRWDPATVSAGSVKDLLWRCGKGHEWVAKPNNRTNGTGCPYCSGRRITVGLNDLATTHPKLVGQAVVLDLTTVSAGSHTKALWRCTVGHEWSALVSERAKPNGTGCPYCSGLKVKANFNDLETTNPELAKQAVGWDPMAVSAGNNKKLLWRCDQGHEWLASPNKRTAGRGCPVCSGNDVKAGFNDLATTHTELAKQAKGWDPTTVSKGSHRKVAWICGLGHEWNAVVKNRAIGRGCPTCTGKVVNIGFNDLATHHPELAREAHGWDPMTVTPGTGKRMLWRCPQGHEWRAVVSSRVRGNGCPICVGQLVLVGTNDLATLFPYLASEADGWDPTTVTAGSGYRKSWRCAGGHTWKAAVVDRVGGTGCAACATYGYDPSAPAWLYLVRHPDYGLLQVGITNQPEIRLASHQSREWEPLDIRGPMDGTLTRSWEKSILATLKSEGADFISDGRHGRFSGYTEAWVEASHPTSSLIELMRAVETREETEPL